MKQWLLILTTILLSTCRQTDESLKFDFVDFTLFQNFTTTSVHLDSNKNVVVQTGSGRNPHRFYTGTLDKTDQDMIDSLLRVIFRSQRDTSIGTPIPDGTAYKIILKNKHKNITVTNWGDTCCKTIAELIFSINKRAKTFTSPFADTNFVFPSRDIIPKPIRLADTLSTDPES